MRVISNWDAENGSIQVEVLDGTHKGLKGVIVGHNGKSMKYGRLYNVRLENAIMVELTGSQVRRLTE